MLKVIDSKQKLLELSKSWDELYQGDPNSTPFQKFAYIYSSIDFCVGKKDTLNIIAIRDAQLKKWVAFFPLYIDSKGAMRFLNAVHTDFCGPLIDPECNRYNVIKEFADYVHSSKAIKGITFDNIEASNPLMGSLKPYFPYLIASDINYYSIVNIERRLSDQDSIDALRGLPSKRKGGLRKRMRGMTIGSIFSMYRKSSGDEYPQGSIDSLIADMVAKGIRVSGYFTDRMMAFWKQLYEDGIIDIAMLYRHGEVASCSFLFYDEKKPEYIEWIILYTDKTWNVTLCLMIEDYIYKNHERGVLNFARGIYDYKLTNFHPDVKPLFCVRIAKTRWGHFRNILSTALHYSKPIIKSWLGR